MENIETKLREEAARLLREKKVDVIIGYEPGTLPLVATPCFISAPEEAGRLVFNPFCVQNLAKFVTDLICEHRDSQKRLKQEEKTKKVIGIVERVKRLGPKGVIPRPSSFSGFPGLFGRQG